MRRVGCTVHGTCGSPTYDPPPADNADRVTAMNDYVTAGLPIAAQ